MNILIITDLYPISDDDNIPYAIEYFALGLKEFGNNITILRPNFLINTIIRNHKIYKEGLYVRNDIEIYNKNLFLPFVFADFKCEKKYDVIISHMPSGNIYAYLLNKKLKLPRIAICHQSDYDVLNKKIYNFYFKKILENALKSATYIGARNKFLKEKLNADFILPSFIEKENIVNNKVLNNEKLKIITLSKLIKRKNIHLVIEALSKVDFDFEYNIFGEGKEKNNLIKLIKKYNLENKVKLNGKIPRNKVFEELDKNDVFILPSVNESFGISYLEAMARGLIVIGCKNTGIDGIIQDNINGYVINPHIDDILNVLNKIKNEDGSEPVKNSLLNIKNYSKEIIIKKYIAKIASCIESNKKCKEL